MSDITSVNGSIYPQHLTPYVEIINKHKEEIKEISWWLNRAIAFVRPYIGECCRKTNWSSDAERDYYKPGKIFRFQNIIAAKKGNGEEDENDQDDN